MKKINFFNRTKQDIGLFRKAIRRTLMQYGANFEMNLIFVEEEEIKRINREYRDIDKITDVISFPTREVSETVEYMGVEIGDCFICLDQAMRQAQDFGHSIIREIVFLAVHGFLHLLGYDHDTKENEEAMLLQQNDLLEKANIRR